VRGIDRPGVVLLPVPDIVDGSPFDFRCPSGYEVVEEVDDDRGCLRVLSGDDVEIGTNRSTVDGLRWVEFCTMTVRHTLAPPDCVKSSSGLASFSRRRVSHLDVVCAVVMTSLDDSSTCR